ncbi:unnamed protein product [Discosporangium mesarthrocarpum]
MADETSGLVKDGICVEADLPLNCKGVGTKWVFKRKVNQFGEVTRYNGRLVRKGYTGLWGIDVYASFMPTLTVEVLRTVLAYTAPQDRELCHWDVRQAFIQAHMEDDIYVRLCDGCGVWSGKTVKLLKSFFLFFLFFLVSSVWTNSSPSVGVYSKRD